jgi:membrane dipeptidase
MKLKERDGVIGICGIGPFIAEKQKDWTVHNMAKHIDYAVKLIGIDHVGLGFDVCYYLSNEVSDNKVEGFKHIDDAPNLFTELSKMGYTNKDLHKIKYDNFARVIKKILK